MKRPQIPLASVSFSKLIPLSFLPNQRKQKGGAEFVLNLCSFFQADCIYAQKKNKTTHSHSKTQGMRKLWSWGDSPHENNKNKRTLSFLPMQISKPLWKTCIKSTSPHGMNKKWNLPSYWPTVLRSPLPPHKNESPKLSSTQVRTQKQKLWPRREPRMKTLSPLFPCKRNHLKTACKKRIPAWDKRERKNCPLCWQGMLNPFFLASFITLLFFNRHQRSKRGPQIFISSFPFAELKPCSFLLSLFREQPIFFVLSRPPPNWSQPQKTCITWPCKT